MPRMLAVLLIMACRHRAANVAIETWSSWLALVGRLVPGHVALGTGLARDFVLAMKTLWR